MNNQIKIQKLIEMVEKEFETQYLADELPRFEDWNDIFIEENAKNSALRLRGKINKEEALALAKLLRSAHQNQEHILIDKICESTWIDWLETSENWSLLQSLLLRIADKLEA
jgi:hypothetical protein